MSWRGVFVVILLVLMSGCMRVGEAKFPTGPITYIPKEVYELPYSRVWNAAVKVLKREGIPILEMDRKGGVITTDYLTGETYLIGLELYQTRYRYFITLEKIGPSKTRLRVKCRLEGMSKDVPWHDISGENWSLVTKLAFSLHEKIEKELEGEAK